VNDEQKRLAIGALTHASTAIANDRPWVAEQWSKAAEEMIRDANRISRDTRRLVAPSDGATTGDKVAIGLSACVLLWMLVSMLSGVWTL